MRSIASSRFASLFGMGILLILVLLVKITHNLDFTDEMQYYGQIKGLILTDKLFSTDLFIQQVVYLLFYPVFKLYHLIFEFEYFVIFGRLLLACALFALYLYVFYSLLKLKTSAFVAGLTAFSLSFAVPYHGIFAISYNTISQILWVAFFVRFLNWPSERRCIWSLIFGLMVFAHPSSAIVMSLLVIIRYSLERNYKQSLRFVGELICSGILTIFVLLQFATFDEYFASLRFSSAFGVGKAFFSGLEGPFLLLQFLALVGFSKYVLSRAGEKFLSVLLLIFSIYFFVKCFDGGTAAYIYVNIKNLAILVSIAYALTNSTEVMSITRFNSRSDWLMVMVIFFAATLSTTSSNGIGQATGAFMVAAPLMIGLTFWSFLGWTPSVLVRSSRILSLSILSCAFVVHWIYNPYRDQSWLRSDQKISEVREFRGIYVSNQRNSFISETMQGFRSEVRGKKLFVAGFFPVVYFLTDALPETCMFYFHSLPTESADIEFRKCMLAKSPEAVLNLFDGSSPEKTISMSENFVGDLIDDRSLSCSKKIVNLERIGDGGNMASSWQLCH